MVSAPATVSDVAVDPDLARRLATAGRKAEEWKDRRDDLIREAARNGASLREIASFVGLSAPGVLRVIRRGGELEVVHRAKQRDGGDPQDPDNIEFLTPNEHARRDRGDG